MRSILPNGVIGAGYKRIEGVAKVTGRALYGADQPVANPAHAWLATSAIARGRVRSIDETAARQLPGVLAILTHENAHGDVRPGKHIIDGGHMSHSITPLLSDRIYFAGQIVAIVIAETLETAEAATHGLEIAYEPETPTASLDSPGAKVLEAKAIGETELAAGNLERGFNAAHAIVDAWYETPAQHHNPMELFQTTCAWQGDELTVWESSQNVRGFQHGLAKQLGISPKKVHVLSKLVGGAFGSRGELSPQTAWIAVAAKRLGRPVKHVASRRQGFYLRTFRAETRHHLRLGADREGHLTALEHLSWELTGSGERFAAAGSEATARLYACPNVKAKVWNVRADRQSPGFMRAPPETPYLFAMESAMDELAYALEIDPVDLRRRNDTMVETVTNRPYTSRSLKACLDRAAEEFGWAQRDPRPRSMRDGDDLVGWGCATAFYPTQVGPAECRVLLAPDLKVTVEVGTHETGSGVCTVIAQTAADLLGLEPDAIEVQVGDSELPAAPMSAGSNSTASVCSTVAKACEGIRDRLARAAVGDKSSPLFGSESFNIHLADGHLVAGGIREPLGVAVRRAARGPRLIQRATHVPHGIPPAIGPALIRRGKPVMAGGSRLKDRMQFGHGAHFLEVRIDRWTGQIRVPRMVSAFAAGRIMNERTARGQFMGGQIWGISAALYEASEIDERTARYVNSDLAEYHIPVNADIGTIESILVHETDSLVNPLGIKGIGELGTTGANAAVANAVFHATGIRVRKLPIRCAALIGEQWPDSPEMRAAEEARTGVKCR
jgi:xanthine dehydrogenase YagR molybdenum-binding subunit